MNIDVVGEPIITSEQGAIYLTPTGAAALLTPLALKDYISNESRKEDGKRYFLSSMKKNDVNITVQFAILSKTSDGMVSLFQKIGEELFEHGKCQVNGVWCLYQGITQIQCYNGSFAVFSARLIKLANPDLIQE